MRKTGTWVQRQVRVRIYSGTWEGDWLVPYVTYYNLTGRRIEKPVRGVYVTDDGKKVIY